MTDLTSDDIELLREEGCLVDAEAAVRSAWDDDQSLHGDPPGTELYFAPDEDMSGDADTWRRVVTTALRAVGLEPGRPSLDLLAAAIERRGWFPALDHQGDGAYIGAVVTQKPERSMRDWRLGADPATALALAFAAAIRAARDAEGATA